MAGTGTRLVDAYKLESLLADSAGNTTTLWIDMDLYSHVTFLVAVNNGTGVTGAAITVNQATTTTGTGSKALAYNNYFRGTGGYAAQTAASDALAQVTGVSGTFTTATTASKILLYAIEIQDTDLDLNNNFDCVQLAIASGAVNATFTVFALCYPRYGGKFDQNPSALT
jgi:hypothetical protein